MRKGAKEKKELVPLKVYPFNLNFTQKYVLGSHKSSLMMLLNSAPDKKG